MRVSEACRSGGYPEPEWHELGTVMPFVFYPHPYVSGLMPLDVLENVPVNDRQKWDCRVSGIFDAGLGMI